MSTLPPKVRVGGLTGGAAKDVMVAARRRRGCRRESSVRARRVRVRFSFLAAGSLSAALRVLAGACGLDFFRAPGEERALLLQRPARSFARGETRVESGKCAVEQPP